MAFLRTNWLEVKVGTEALCSTHTPLQKKQKKATAAGRNRQMHVIIEQTKQPSFEASEERTSERASTAAAPA